MKGKVIILLGVVMGLVAGVLVLLTTNKGQIAAAGPTPEPPAVVRAVQNIAKGQDVTLEMVQLVRLQPGEPVPPGAIKDPLKAAGMTAAIDIPQGTVIQAEMLFDKRALLAAGEQASRLFQPGRVAFAFPITPNAAVAGALRPGDRVDVIAAFEFVDLDQARQALLPVDGSYEQLPRMVVQTILQDIEVLRVGQWGAPAQQAGGSQQGAPAANSSEQVLTLLVTPQDALVLKYLAEKMDEGQARVAFALRSQDEQEVVQTEAVTLEYMMRRFHIPVPPRNDITTTEIVPSSGSKPR